MASIVVVGAGAGGLVGAGYLRAAGHDLLLLEAKARVGGCASRFTVGEFTFLAGATTVIGLEPTMPLGRVLAELGVTIDAAPLSPALTAWHHGEPLVFSTDAEANARALTLRYGAALGRFSTACVAIAERAWRLIGSAPFPPEGVSDLARLGTTPTAWASLPHLLTTTEALLARCGEPTADARALVDELLVISTQATARDCPALFGAIGIEYLQRPLFAPRGGLAGLLEALGEALVQEGVDLRTEVTVERVEELSPGFRVHTSRGVFAADAVLLDLTHWDAARLVDGPTRAAFERQAARHPRGPGAIGMYLGVEDVFDDVTPYHQIVLDEPLAGTHARSLFVTLSPRDDPEFAPIGQRALTISGHVDADMVAALSDTAHQELKGTLERGIREALHRVFPRLASARELVAMTATPRTWERYTGRARGRVGGLPFTFDTLLHGYPTGFTKNPRLARVGDTVFPGQSVVAVAWGARRVAGALTRALR